MSTPKPSLSENLVELTLRIIAGYTTVLACLVGTVIAGALLFAGLNGVDQAQGTIASPKHVFGENFSSHKLLSLRIDGEIDGQAPVDDADRLIGVVYGYELKQQLYDAAKDPDIAGVILEINSPGGTIYGAQAIADGVKHYRDTTHHPVYAHVSGLAASGGYWVAASADRIIADLGSSLGSIGVIDGPYKYYDKVLSETTGEDSVITQNGIQSVTITAGKGKDEGDPYQKLTPEETANIQRAVNDDYAVFVDYISTRRHIATDIIRTRLGAYVYGTQVATTEKLIDATAGREDAYAQLASAAGLKADDYEVVRPDTISEVTSADEGFAAQALSLLTGRHAARTSSTPQRAASTRKCASGTRAYYGDISALCSR